MSHLLAKTLAVVVFVALMTTAAATAAWADSPTPTTAPTATATATPSPTATAPAATATPTPPAFSAPAVDSASAQLKNASGQVVGSAQFFQDGQGVVQVKVDVTGLPAGSHGIHIHTVGKCDPPDFTTAGGHFNPGAKKHGLLNPEGPHAGDLPVLTVDASGGGSLQTATNRVTIAAGAVSVLDSDGSALVIHAAADDQLTDPTGNSGARIACGVIAKAPAFSAPAVDSASAQLKNASGQAVGSAQFDQDGQGVVQVKVDVTGLPAGSHGIHIHTVGKCDAPDFTTAGGHFNPGSKKHGLLSTEGPHAGDLPVLTVDASGAGSLQTTTSRISVAAGATSILDSDGSALVIHAAADDQLTDPTGNSGARIACGVIQRVAALPPTGGEPSSGFGIGVVAVLALGFVALLGGASVAAVAFRRRS